MTVFPLRRSVGFKAATASSRVETLPMFVRSRPSRTRRTISLSWARLNSTTKSTAKPSAGRASAGPTTDTSVPPARNQACGPLLDVAADDIEHQIDATDVFQRVVVEVNEFAMSAEGRGHAAASGRPAIIHGEGTNRSPSPNPHGRTRMTVFPLRRSVGFKAATASSRIECSVTVAAIGPGRGPLHLSRDEFQRMNLNDDVVYRWLRLGRSTSFIPAVPAACSVTTIAFIVRLPVSSPRLHVSPSRRAKSLIARPRISSLLPSE